MPAISTTMKLMIASVAVTEMFDVAVEPHGVRPQGIDRDQDDVALDAGTRAPGGSRRGRGARSLLVTGNQGERQQAPGRLLQEAIHPARKTRGPARNSRTGPRKRRNPLRN